MHRPLRLCTLLAASVVAAPALAQRAPRPPAAPNACTNTNPSELVATQRPSAVSAVFSEDPLRLWVLYTDRDYRTRDREAVSLLEISGLDTQRLSVNTLAVGEGRSTQGALAVAGSNVVAAWARPAQRVGVMMHPLAAGGADATASLEAPSAPQGLVVTSVRDRALVAWDDSGAGLRYGWLDARAALAGGGLRAVTGRYAIGGAAGAFGGAVFVLDSEQTPPRLAWLRGTGRPRVGRVPAVGREAPASGAGVSSAAVGSRAMALYAADGRARVTTVRAASGAGATRDVGPAGAGAETALSATPWGAFGAWADSSGVRVVALDANGAPAGESFSVWTPRPGERARTPAVAANSTMGVVIFTVTPARAQDRSSIRMVRVVCH